MEVTRLFDLLKYSVEKFSKETALAGKRSDNWASFSSAEFESYSDQVSYALLAAGVKPGDRVANISGNRPEWNFVDMGSIQMGAVHVPIYPVISRQELVFILNETGANITFVDSKYVYNKLISVHDQLISLKRIILFEPLPETESFKAFLKTGNPEKHREQLSQIKSDIHPDDLATIIYTSGTTANPKGVMLSHNNIVNNFKAVAPTFKLQPDFVALSYLPLCHVYERMLNYMYIYSGVSVYYAESTSAITGNIREICPQVVTTVPLLLEKIYGEIIERGNALQGARKRTFNKAVELALNFPLSGRPGLVYNMKKWYYDRLFYRKWREDLGGRLSRFICGGAALQQRILKFFWAAGIPVYEGYGLTETSPVISNNSNMSCKLGTVGSVIHGIEVKIGYDGEILTKGPCVMLGYYQHPEPTFNVIDSDGWFHTGDVGEMVDRKFLRLTGRKKILFKTTSGEYVSPEAIENQIKQSPFISQAMVVGANQSFLGALIVPDFNYILSWFEKRGLPFFDDAVIANHTLVMREIEQVIWNYNKNVFETERIEKFHIMTEEWTIEKGELTPKMSIKRDFIVKKYQSIIDGFFQSP
jgi:long-chain acyl-CoA synthetase